MDSSALVPTSAAASTLTLLSALTPVMMLLRLGSSAKGLRSARLVNPLQIMHVAFQFFKVFFSMKNAFGELLVTPNKKENLHILALR